MSRAIRQEVGTYWNPDHDAEVQVQLDDLQQQLDDIVADVRAPHSDEVATLRAEINAMMNSP